MGNPMRGKLTTGLIVGLALATAGCSTALSRACESGQGYNGMPLEDTCIAAQVEQQRHNNEVLLGVGAALTAAVAAAAVAEAYHRDNYNTYVYPAPGYYYGGRYYYYGE